MLARVYAPLVLIPFSAADEVGGRRRPRGGAGGLAVFANLLCLVVEDEVDGLARFDGASNPKLHSSIAVSGLLRTDSMRCVTAMRFDFCAWRFRRRAS